MKKIPDLYENAPIAYLSMDVQGNITKCNHNVLKLSGYSKEDLMGRPARELYVTDEAGIITPEGVRQMLEQGRPVRDVEMRFRHRSGREVWISISLDAVRDRGGKIIEFRAMVIDISERKGLEKQLLQAQKMEAVGTLAGGIAHDFNNILTPISGYAEMLLMETDDQDTRKKERLKIIHDCALYAKGLVNQILTFSLQRENEFKLLQPHTFVRDALALARSFVPATIDIREKINEDCPLLMVDPIQAHQVVMNLISNAYHAMEDTGGVLDVVLDKIVIERENEVYPLKPGTYIYLKFSDTGHGISQADQEKIFDPFFTTKKEGKGSGIGLSVVHGIIRSHNGHITVRSKEGEGACFEIYLPAYAGDIRPGDQRKEERPIIKGSESILLVDDDSKVAFMEQQMLETLGYRVTCHLNGPEALSAFSRSPGDFDLVITDLTMPKLTGYQLAEKISDIRPGIPIILCTGYGEHIHKKKYDPKAISGFLHKPLAIKDVSHLIRDILDKR
nr:PAS domain S-box protein [Desulfobacula sp.]